MDIPQKLYIGLYYKKKETKKQKGYNLPGYWEIARIMDICGFQKKLKEVK